MTGSDSYEEAMKKVLTASQWLEYAEARRVTHRYHELKVEAENKAYAEADEAMIGTYWKEGESSLIKVVGFDDGHLKVVRISDYKERDGPSIHTQFDVHTGFILRENGEQTNRVVFNQKVEEYIRILSGLKR